MFDLARVPFSRFGSYFAISRYTGASPGLYLRSLHGQVARREICRIEALTDAGPADFTEAPTPTTLALHASGRETVVCMPDPKTVRFTGAGRLRLTWAPEQDYALEARGGALQVVSWAQSVRYLLTPLAGQLTASRVGDPRASGPLTVDIAPDPATGGFDLTFVEFVNATPEPRTDTPAASKQAVLSEWRQWLDAMPEAPVEYAQARELAAYVLWSAVIAPEGHLRRPAMLMSKNWMVNVWSWDHCFNAMALAAGASDLAWDQFMLPFDHQDEAGALPDCVNDREILRIFTKPPIHGWTLDWMWRNAECVEEQRLQLVYEPLARWTRWWLRERDDDADGLPQYDHGNDSGWDNSTAFDLGHPAETPDLPAFLILQMDTLARIAETLGRAGEAAAWRQEAAAWRQEADALQARLTTELWHGDHFAARRDAGHDICDNHSLLPYLPLVLGARLPASQRDPLVQRLKQEDRFLTPHGLATEDTTSPKYECDGYWRGPIWAPAMLLLIDGLHRAGETSFAHDLARRFCDTCRRSGFAENFDAQTGAPLCDKAYTWTASVFLILVSKYLH